jgi:hypothetical protein
MGLKVWESDQQKILIFGDGLFWDKAHESKPLQLVGGLRYV